MTSPLRQLLREHQDEVRALFERFEITDVRLANDYLESIIGTLEPGRAGFIDAEDELCELLGVSVILVSASSRVGREITSCSLPWEEAITPAVPIDGYAIGDRIQHYTSGEQGIITSFRAEARDGHRFTVAVIRWDDPSRVRGSLAAFQMRLIPTAAD